MIGRSSWHLKFKRVVVDVRIWADAECVEVTVDRLFGDLQSFRNHRDSETKAGEHLAHDGAALEDLTHCPRHLRRHLGGLREEVKLSSAFVLSFDWRHEIGLSHRRETHLRDSVGTSC